MNKEMLESHGINYDKGTRRCMNDCLLYEKILMMFVDSDLLDRAEQAYSSRNYGELFNCMHELKGAAGNAELNTLYDAVCPLVELLRTNNDVNENIVAKLYEKMHSAYISTSEAIKLAALL